jgi:adenylate cyclase
LSLGNWSCSDAGSGSGTPHHLDQHATHLERLRSRTNSPSPSSSLNILQLLLVQSEIVTQFVYDGQSDLFADFCLLGADCLNIFLVEEDSVERSGNRVRITAQLVYGPEDRNLWAQSYERDLRDVLTLQNTVASAIADEIQVKMTTKEEARLHSPKFFGDLAAHEAYLRGSYYLNEPRGCAQAVEFFQQAILREPNPRAYVGLARAYECLSGIDETPREVLPKAEAAARKALALDEDLSDAHLLLGKTKFQLHWDWPGAEKEFRRAIELNLNSAAAHLGYAVFLDSMGRMEEAERERLRAQEVDPLNELMNEVFYHKRQYQNAIEVLRKNVELNPKDMGLHWQLGILYDQTGMRDEAIREWERMFVLSGYEQQYGFAEDLKRGYLTSGRRGALNRVLNNLERVSRQRHVPPDIMAYLYESVGDKEWAFVWLQKAYDEHNHEIVGLKTDLMWDGLRSDPRFEDLVRRVGLPQ